MVLILVEVLGFRYGQMSWKVYLEVMYDELKEVKILVLVKGGGG